jgi:signal transduction histidine kinase
MDPAARKVLRGKREVRLSPKELDLLQLLMRRPGETMSRQQLLLECWGTQETDSNLVDVYVNYLRKKVDSFGTEKLIHTVRGAGYRLGKPAPTAVADPAPGGDDFAVNEPVAVLPEQLSPPTHLPSGPLRALVHAITHDLAQPLTTIRCFLEMLAMRSRETLAQPAEMSTIEHQADRAIALTKSISAMVRELPPPVSPWIAVETLFNDLLADLSVLLQSGQLTLEREWEGAIHVSSSPVLRQLLVFFLSKLVARNSHPFVMTIAAVFQEGRCHLDLRWRPRDLSQKVVPDSRIMLAREFASVREIVHSLGGELILPEGRSEISLVLPAAAGATHAAGK